MMWCTKCGGMVSALHRHWGKADYVYSGGWFCRWCRSAMPDNETNCTCVGWKANKR